MANAGSFRKGEKRPGQGRPKGSTNKDAELIRDMVCRALGDLGGVKYLTGVAKSHPGPFLALVGKTMPIQVGGDPANPLQTVHRIEIVALKPK